MKDITCTTRKLKRQTLRGVKRGTDRAVDAIEFARDRAIDLVDDLPVKRILFVAGGLAATAGAIFAIRALRRRRPQADRADAFAGNVVVEEVVIIAPDEVGARGVGAPAFR